MADALTPKQQRFVEEYLVDLNATEAAIRAGYSAKTANQQGPRLLVNVGIAAAIAEAQAARSERTGITADRVLEELARIGFANMRDYATWGPGGVTLKNGAGLSEEQAAAVAEVSEVKTEKGGSVRFKLHDKHAALVSMGKHLGMFTEKHEHSGTIVTKIERVIVYPKECDTKGERVPAAADMVH